MKQQRNGRKVQNWHRPLGKNALRQRFINRRKTPIDTEWEPRNYWDDEPDRDHIWTDWWPEHNANSEDVVGYEFRSAIDRLVGPHSFLLQPPFTRNAGHHPLFAWEMVRSADLILSLADFKPTFSECSHSLVALESIWRVLNKSGVHDALARIHGELADFHLLHSACWYAPFWIRNPAEWAGGNARSLIDHLFVRYAPPDCLYGAWTNKEQPFKWISWFLVLAQGAELPLAGRQFDWEIPRRLVQFLYEVPASFHPIESCIYAEIRRRGGCDVDIHRVLRNPAFIMDPTEPGTETHSRFWRETISWLIENRNRLSDAEADLVLSWSMHEFTEAVQFGQSFSMTGRGVRSCLERSRTYQHQLTRRWEDFRWDSHGWNWSFADGEGAQWTFKELTSGIELYAEGTALHHCVATYASRCVAGRSAIVSVQRNEVRCVTVEIDPRNGKLAQARGLCNRDPDDFERQIIQSWHAAIVAKSFAK